MELQEALWGICTSLAGAEKITKRYLRISQAT